MANLKYNIGAVGIANGSVDFLVDTIEVLFTKSTYTANKDDTNTVLAAAELASLTGYVPGYNGAGRKVLASKTVTNDTTNDRSVYDAADPSVWTIAAGDTIGGMIVQKKGSASDATAVPLDFIDFTDTPTNGGTVTVTFDANGISYTQQ